MLGSCGFAKRRPRRSRRGFSMFVVTLLVGLMVLTAVAVYRALEEDATQQGHERRRREAFRGAEGGLMELINDKRIMGLLPKEAGESATFVYVPPEGSEAEIEGVSYSAEVTLVRTAPLLESSRRRVRALLYEARVLATYPTGETAEVESIIYRLGSALNSRAGMEIQGK